MTGCVCHTIKGRERAFKHWPRWHEPCPSPGTHLHYLALRRRTSGEVGREGCSHSRRKEQKSEMGAGWSGSWWWMGGTPQWVGSQSCCGWVGSREHPVGEDKEVGSCRLAAGILTPGRLGRGAVHSALAVAM